MNYKEAKDLISKYVYSKHLYFNDGTQKVFDRNSGKQITLDESELLKVKSAYDFKSDLSDKYLYDRTSQRVYDMSDESSGIKEITDESEILGIKSVLEIGFFPKKIKITSENAKEFATALVRMGTDKAAKFYKNLSEEEIEEVTLAVATLYKEEINLYRNQYIEVYIEDEIADPLELDFESLMPEFPENLSKEEIREAILAAFNVSEDTLNAYKNGDFRIVHIENEIPDISEEEIEEAILAVSDLSKDKINSYKNKDIRDHVEDEIADTSALDFQSLSPKLFPEPPHYKDSFIGEIIATSDKQLNEALSDSLTKIEESGKKIEEIFETDLGLEADSDEILLAQVAEIEKQQDTIKKAFSKKVEDIIGQCENQKNSIEEFAKLSDEEVEKEITARERELANKEQELKDLEATLNPTITNENVLQADGSIITEYKNANQADVMKKHGITSRISELKSEIESLRLSRDKTKGLQRLQKYIDHLKLIKDMPLNKIGKNQQPKVDFVQVAQSRKPIEEYYYDANITKVYYATPRPKTVNPINYVRRNPSNATNVQNSTQPIITSSQNVVSQNNTSGYKSLESILEEIDNNSSYSEMQKKVLKAKKIKFYAREKEKWEQEQAKNPREKFADSQKIDPKTENTNADTGDEDKIPRPIDRDGEER